MNILARLSIACTAVALLSFAVVSGYWRIPAGSKARFAIDGLMDIDAKGSLTFDSSSIRFDPAHPEEGTMYVQLSTASINTGIGKRDRHLRTADFLDAEKYPTIRFMSTAIAKTAEGYRVTGELTVKDVTKTETIPFLFSEKGNGGIFTGAFRINRLDYHVGEGYRKSIGKQVRITLEVPVNHITE